MAEGKPTGIISDSEAASRIIGILAILILIGAIASALQNYIQSLLDGNLGSVLGGIWDFFLRYIWPLMKILAVIISVLSVIGIIYSNRRIGEINAEENKVYGPPVEGGEAEGSNIVLPKNERWERIIVLINSGNSSDWRHAIIEADVMLEEHLRKIGYPGETMGDMLKSANKNDFITLDEAWEAHKVRNRIAHSGEGFELNEREAKRVIALFEKVFREFNVI